MVCSILFVGYSPAILVRHLQDLDGEEMVNIKLMCDLEIMDLGQMSFLLSETQSAGETSVGQSTLVSY